MWTTNTDGVSATVIESQSVVHHSFTMLSRSYVESNEVNEAKALVAELCRHCYTLGWLPGTGGSVTVKVHNDSIPKPHQLIVMTPSGVQKERVLAEDMYVLSSDGFIVSTPPLKPYPCPPPKLTDCAPLFLKAYEICNAGAVIHSHGMEACLVTMINPFSNEFRITHMEMIKGIQGHGYHDELVIPIIENTAHERELLESLSEAMRAYPKTTAVLVRNHGVFIWGYSWINAKTQAECYHYLFDAAIKLHQLGLDWSSPNHGPLRNVNGLCRWSGNFSRGVQIQEDLEQGVAAAVPIPPDYVGRELVIASLAANVKAMIHTDRKVTWLKQLQGRIWRDGLQSNELVGVVFEDAPEALERWQTSGIKVYKYSSVSREVQQLLFANSAIVETNKSGIVILRYCKPLEVLLLGQQTCYS